MSSIRQALLAGLLVAPVASAAQEVEAGKTAALRALDRLSGELTDLAVPVGGSAPLGRLSVSVIECRYPANNPAGDAFAFVEIHDLATRSELFSGWMIASSPALNAFDHMRYDVWVMRCTTA